MFVVGVVVIVVKDDILVVDQRKKLGTKEFGLKEIWVKWSFVQKNVGPQNLRSPKNWVAKVSSKLGQ